MSVGREALAIAHLRRAFTHVHLAEIKILVGVHPTVAIAEIVVQLQLLTFSDDFLFAIQAVLRSLWMLVGLSGTSAQAAHPPAVCELPYLIF